MNNKNLVKLSNVIGIVSILLLIYWVFVFISVEVFGLKVFRENMTQTFMMSILGILALMFGSLMMNIMFNLTRIAEKHNIDTISKTVKFSRWKLVFGLSFPLIFILLLAGDYFTSRTKEKMLIDSAKSIVEENPNYIQKLVDYEFERKWLKETGNILSVMSSTDRNFPGIVVIVKDSLDGTNILLGFREYDDHYSDSIAPAKKHFIFKTTKEDRIYLNQVFEGKTDNLKFSASDGNYELYYPCERNKKKIVLYFSDYQRYGKMGS